MIGVSFNADYDFEHKVNAAASGCVRSPLLMRTADMIRRFLIRHGMSAVFEVIKRSGAKQLVFKQGDAFALSETDLVQAREYLAPSTKWYNERFR